jgi:putative transposase
VPDVVEITDGKKADVTIGKIMNLETKLEKWSFVIFDRWYVDYERYKKLNDNWLFFVTRSKRNMDYLVIESKDVGINWVQRDEVIEVFNPNGKPYKWKLRLVHYISPDDGREYQFLTNNFHVNSKIIALLYKKRWEVELFFKFIKQNLKIKSFLWTSENAVRNQLRVAMIYYLIVCYIKFKTKVKQWLLELCRLFSESLLLRFKIIDILGLTPQYLQEISKFSRYWPVQESLF